MNQTKQYKKQSNLTTIAYSNKYDTTCITYKVLYFIIENGFASAFTDSLINQYLQGKKLSIKQLEVLYCIAVEKEVFPVPLLAELDAEIMQMHSGFNSPKPTFRPVYEKDKGLSNLINAILAINPFHKRALYLKAKFDYNEVISTKDKDDLKGILRALAN